MKLYLGIIHDLKSIRYIHLYLEHASYILCDSLFMLMTISVNVSKLEIYNIQYT